MTANHPGMQSPATPAAPVRIWRDSFGECQANVPRTVVWHSPDGYEVGYGGSGPADLALNILNTFVPATSSADKVKCYRGHCSAFAARHHQDFKVEFIARMPRAGGEIPADVITAWIEERRT